MPMDPPQNRQFTPCREKGHWTKGHQASFFITVFFLPNKVHVLSEAYLKSPDYVL